VNLQRRVLGPASARWNDYVGTAAADDADVVISRPSLYELASVDRSRYTIVAVDLAVWETTTTVSVFAVDRVANELADQADLDELGRTRGEIPVVEFTLPSQHVEEFLENAFKRISLRLVARGVREYELAVTESL
jgi:hypothetical protein